MYDYEKYDDYPQRPRRIRRGHSLHWKWLTAALLVLALVCLRFCHHRPHKPAEPPTRTEVVRVVDWQAVDVRIRSAVEDAHAAARRHAETAVDQWIRRLRERVENDFLPWIFSYWNQQAMALKAIGYYLADTPLAEGLVGKQPSARSQLETVVEEAFAARVL